MPRLGGHDVKLGKARFVQRPMTEIVVDRRYESRFVLRDDPRESLEPITARRNARIALGLEGATLHAQQSIERGFRVVGGCVHQDRAGRLRTTAAVPATINAVPASIGSVIVSSRNSRPHSMPNAGIRNVTVIARVGPTSAISRK